MSKRRRTLLFRILLCVLLATGILFVKNQYKPNTLTLGLFSGSVWDVPNLIAYMLYDEAIDGFVDANPGVKIQYRSGTLKEDYSEWLFEKLLLGEEPDVFLVFNSDFDTLARVGALQNLNTLIDRDDHFSMDAFYKNAASLGKYEDGYYALPMELNPMVMGINLDLLNREGVVMPEGDLTWDEFYEICSKVTKDLNGDGVIDQFGCVGFDWQQAVNTNSVKLFDVKNNRGLFNSEKTRKSLEFVKKLNSLNEGQKASIGDFEKGSIAFIVFPFSEYLSYSRYPYKITRSINFNWKCMKLPNGPNGNSAGTFQSLLVGMNAKCKNKELAWKFMKHLVYNDSVQSDVYRYSFGVPVIKSIAESKHAQEKLESQIPDTNFKLNPTTLSDIIETSYMPERFSNYEKAMDLADKELYSAFDNGSDLTRALQVLNKKINDLLQVK